jgi:hypothetical protein
MARKKRSLFRELLAGVRAMRDHADGKLKLRTTQVKVSYTKPEEAVSRPTSSRLQSPENRGSQA